MMKDVKDISQADQDKKFMRLAYQEALKAFEKEEVPVGAVLVYRNKVIARAHNQVEMLQDATAHAEMLCLTMGSSALGNWRLLDTVLYCTLEPCVMCAGAMLLSRVGRLVWGTADHCHGAMGSWVNLFKKKHPFHQIEVSSGVLSSDCASLLQEFFRKCRQEKKQ